RPPQAPPRPYTTLFRSEMLEEFGGHVFVNRVGLRQFKRHRKHRQTVKAHPRRAVRLLQESSSRERLRPIEHPNVIKAEKTAGKEDRKSTRLNSSHRTIS